MAQAFKMWWRRWIMAAPPKPHITSYIFTIPDGEVADQAALEVVGQQFGGWVGREIHFIADVAYILPGKTGATRLILEDFIAPGTIIGSDLYDPADEPGYWYIWSIACRRPGGRPGRMNVTVETNRLKYLEVFS
jgi:hypothetical protein